MYSRIAGTGSYLPEKILTNADLEKIVDTSDEWIRTRTGIERAARGRRGRNHRPISPSRRRARAMAGAGVGPGDIDLICVGTTTPDSCFPNVGTLLQDRAWASTAVPAFSLEAACTGFHVRAQRRRQVRAAGRGKVRAGVGAETLDAHRRLERPRQPACCSRTAPAPWS